MIAFPAWRPADIISWLGLGSVGISFLFQDIFKYFLAEIFLLLHEPFQLGDRIIVEGFEGNLEKILLRSTQLISDLGEQVIVPKASVFTNSVRILTTIAHRRTNLRLILAYDTDLPEQLKPWLNLFPSKAFCPKQLEKLIVQALTKLPSILFSAIGRCMNKHRCDGQKTWLWWRLK
ncbi:MULTISPECIES: mechanosensitive ion channel domain-containing protein [unclassified Microcoleus]|uniref:mechanosensitive ion channel domain-containing protein n=1 Tax=unclassified Microcoleus TaxID=2642155 RepID=UPI002FD2F29E